jgi:hypothetical protein
VPTAGCLNRLSNPRPASATFFRRNSLTHPVTTVTASRFVLTAEFCVRALPFSDGVARPSWRSERLMILIRLSVAIIISSPFVQTGFRIWNACSKISQKKWQAF